MVIRNGKVALPGEADFQKVDILIEGEKITRIGNDASTQKNFSDDEIIDATGLLVLPGGIDPHVHFDDPGYTDREDFYRGSCSAASGGVTTVIDMPDTSVPPVTNRENLIKKLEAIERKAVVDFGLYGGVSAQSYQNGFPRNMEELADTVLGFKTYFISGMESFGRLDHFQFQQVLNRAKELGLPVLLHAEDYEYVTAATTAAMKEGETPRYYYKSRPETAEVLAALCAAKLAEETGADLHLVHIGSAGVCAVLVGDRITGETGPQYLEFDVTDFERAGSSLKCTPPVKSRENREKLWQCLSEGTISFVASDHAPCSVDEKNTGSIWTDYAGIPGCPTLLPYLFSEGYIKGRVSLPRFLEIISSGAAQRYGIFQRKGSIETGKDADFALVDPEDEWTVRGKELYSKGTVTPFEEMVFRGRVVKTILRGRLVYTSDSGILAEAGYGSLVKK